MQAGSEGADDDEEYRVYRARLVVADSDRNMPAGQAVRPIQTWSLCWHQSLRCRCTKTAGYSGNRGLRDDQVESHRVSGAWHARSHDLRAQLYIRNGSTKYEIGRASCRERV